MSINSEQLQRHIYQVEQIITRVMTGYIPVSETEVLSYFSEPAPSEDTTTIEDVINNQWLLIHELIELSELKKMGLKISPDLLHSHPHEVEKAHLIATRWELRLATTQVNSGWVKQRLNDVKSWSEDSALDKEFREKYDNLYREMSE